MTSSQIPPSRVSVIGLGPMGQAMTHLLLQAAQQVTVWNRTPSKADAVVAAGAHLAATPGEALEAADLVIVSLTDYTAMWQILAGHETSLAGRTVVNLSSDTPKKTRSAATWAAGNGAAFLTGGIMVPAPMLGTEDAYVYYSGDQQAFEEYRSMLSVIGEPRFVGEDAGRAQLMYQAHLDLFLTVLAGVAHATALVGTAGISAQSFLPELMQLYAGIPEMIAPDGPEDLGKRIDAGDHADEGSSNAMLGATADHIVATARAVGVDAGLPTVVQDLYRKARSRGWDQEGWTRAVEIFTAPSHP